MPDEIIYIAAVAVSYLVGAIPFGFVFAKGVKGIDLREVGSKNVGATNAARAIGFGWFFPIFALDFLKGFAPAFWLAAWVWNTRPGDLPHGGALLAVLCGVSAMVGHMWPVYLRLRGGKGVATGAGIIFALNWIAGLIALGVWLLVFFATRYVSLGSIVAAVAMAAAHLCTAGRTRFGEEVLPVTVFCILAALLVVVRHHTNIRRLMRGEEAKIRFSRKHE